jgi:hypothetical protein
VHWESRERPGYALVLGSPDGRLGPNIRPSDADCVAFREAIEAGKASGTYQLPLPPPGPPAADGRDIGEAVPIEVGHREVLRHDPGAEAGGDAEGEIAIHRVDGHDVYGAVSHQVRHAVVVHVDATPLPPPETARSPCRIHNLHLTDSARTQVHRVQALRAMEVERVTEIG